MTGWRPVNGSLFARLVVFASAGIGTMAVKRIEAEPPGLVVPRLSRLAETTTNAPEWNFRIG